MADPFQPRFVDLVRNFTTTQGTGAFVLGPAVNGYTSFTSALQPGDSFYYSAIGIDKPNEREVGRGTLLANGNISREPISGGLTNFTNGTKSVALIAAAEWFSKIEQGGGASGGSTAVAATRSALAAVPASGAVALLSEAGREGLFAWDGSDLSDLVAADTAQAIRVPPASDPTGASGAWVRQFKGPLVFDWFGAIPGDYATGVGADCVPAWNALMAYIEATRRNVSVPWQAAGPEILFPGNQYFFSERIDIAKTVRLRGMGVGQPGGEPTWLRFPADSGGLLVTADANHTGAGTLIEGFLVQGDGGSISGTLTTDLLKSGIRLLQRATIRDCFIRNFAGAGICISAAVGNPDTNFNGNANNWHVSNCRVESNKCGGVYVSGGDANAGVGTAIDATLNGRWGIYDASFLGNSWIGCHTDANGGPIASSHFNGVYDAGFNYYARRDATHAQLTSAAPASNANWISLGAAGGPSPAFPQWSATPTGTYVSGGAYGNSNGFSVFTGCYYETGQTPPQISSLVLGGFMYGTASDGPWISPSSFGANSQTGWAVVDDANSVKSRHGGIFFGGYKTLLAWNSPVATGGFDPDRWSGLGLEKSTGDIAYWAIYASGNIPVGHTPDGGANTFRITSFQTARTYGATTAEAGGCVEVNKIALGDRNNARIISRGSAAPSTGTHAQGEIQFNTGITAASPLLAWACTTAGAPGTHTSLYCLTAAPAAIATSGSASDLATGTIPPGRFGTVNAAGAVTSSGATAGVGYASGAGGTVTQATNKSTGVTINKASGQITTHGASMASAAVVSFTVTNSAVAATDTINLNLASGNATAGAYRHWVEGIANGSFKIVIENRSGGSLAEVLVFNFAVVKAVSA
jgi:hypothetical protein